jgi:pentatricopeptide repeat protein
MKTPSHNLTPLPPVFDHLRFVAEMPLHAYGAHYYYLLNLKKYKISWLHENLPADTLVLLLKRLACHRFPFHITRTRVVNILSNQHNVKGNIPLDAILIYLRVSVQARCRESIRECFEMITINKYPFNIKLYGELLEIYCSHHDPIGTLQLYQRMLKEKIAIDFRCANLILSCLSSAGDLDSCGIILKKFKDKKIMISRSVTLQICTAYARKGYFGDLYDIKYVKESQTNETSELNEASKLIDKASSTHTNLFNLSREHAISNALIPKFEKRPCIFNVSSEIYEKSPSALVTFVKMSLSSDGNANEVKSGLELVETLTADVRLHLRTVLFIAIVDSLRKNPKLINGYMIENILANIEAISINMLETNTSGTFPSVLITSLTILFRQYGRSKKVIARLLELCVHSGQKSNVILSVGSYHRLLRYYLDLDQFQESYDLYIHLTRHNGNDGTSIAPDEAIVHIFLVYFLKKKRYDQGLEMYKKMLSDGARANERVLKVLCELTINKLNLCKAYWMQLCNYISPNSGEMLIRDERIDSHYFRPIFVAYIKRRHYDEARKILVQMRNLRFSPTYSMYVSLGMDLIFRGEPRHVALIFQLLAKVGHYLKPQIFNLQMKSWRETNNMKEIERVLPLMKRYNLKPNGETFHILIISYLKNSEIEKARLCLEEMILNGYKPEILLDLFMENPLLPLTYHQFVGLPLPENPKFKSFFDDLFMEKPCNEFQHEESFNFPYLKTENIELQALLEELKIAVNTPAWVDRSYALDILREKYNL